MSNSLLSLSKKTKYTGIYSKYTKKGIAYIARYTIHGKTKTKIIGYENDGMTEYDAYKTKLDIMHSEELMIATIKTNQMHLQIEVLFKDFMQQRRVLLAKNTIDNYRSIYNQYILKDFNGQDIRNISNNDLQRYINKVLTYRRPATVEKIVSALRKFYIHLQNEGIYKYNPAANLIMPKYDNKKYFSMTKRDVRRFINYINNIENEMHKTIYYMLLHGRRINEILTLRWTDVDLMTKTYNLDYTKTKTRKNQRYHLEDFQYKSLVRLREKSQKAIYVFENKKTGKPITYTSFHKVHKKTRETLELDDFVIHNIRHLVAFLVVNNGYSLEVTAKILGHKTIQSTQRYAVLEMDKARKAYSKTIQSFIE